MSGHLLFVRVGKSPKVHLAERLYTGYATRCGLYASRERLGYWMQTASGATEATCRRCAPAPQEQQQRKER